MEPPAGTTKSVVYKSATLLGCYCGGDVIICVDSELTYNCAPFIEGHLDRVVCGIDSCGRRQYSYYLSYDANYLADPSSQLYSLNIEGVVCRDCLTQYIDHKAPFFTTCDGANFTYVLPGCVPVVGATLVVESIDGNEVTLKWSNCS